MTISLQTAMAVGLGGFLGAIARLYINNYISLSTNSEFPYGILFVNILGSLLIGILFAIFIHYNTNATLKVFLTTGFLGALTTYSTFAIESFFLLNSSFFLGLANIFFNLLGTILAAGSGYKMAFFFLK